MECSVHYFKYTVQVLSSVPHLLHKPGQVCLVLREVLSEGRPDRLDLLHAAVLRHEAPQLVHPHPARIG